MSRYEFMLFSKRLCRNNDFYRVLLLIFWGIFSYCQKKSDTLAPDLKISNVQARANPNSTLSYYIQWHTNLKATATVAYGLTKEYGQLAFENADTTTHHKVLLPGLSPEQEYHFRVLSQHAGTISKSKNYTFTTASLPEKFPKATIKVADASQYYDGVTFMFLYPYVVAINMHGDFVWYYQMTEGFKLINPIKKLDNGNLLMGIYSTDREKSTIREINMAGDLVKEYQTPGYHHDFLVLPDGKIAYIKATVRSVNGNNLVGDDIVEIDASGATQWSWSLFDHIQPVDYCLECSKRYFYGGLGDDWTHANTLVYQDADNSYYLSIRHTDSILKIDRTTGTIIWEFGGARSDFNLVPIDQFSHQHAVELLANGNVLLFDNGNHRIPIEQSRVVEYELNLSQKSAVKVWEYRFSGENRFSKSYGDVDRLPNGNTLVADFHNTVTEVTPSGQIVWQAVLYQPRTKLHRVLRLTGLYGSEF